MQGLKLYVGLCCLVVNFFVACAQRKTNSASPWQTNYKMDRPSGAVVSALRAGKEQRLLVVLKHDAETMGLSDDNLNSSSDDAIAARAAKYKELKQMVIASAQGKNVKSEDIYSHLPIIKISVKNITELLAVANDQNVVAISEDVKFTNKATANLNLIKQPEAIQTGFNGSNTSVAILDTGLDYKRSAFGSCTAPGAPATCRVVYVQDFAANDNILDDSVLHGTNVAGIVASVAPGTKLIGLDVFDGDGAYTSDIVNAINWVISNKSKYNIAAMNMSFGSTGFSNCTTGSMAVAIGSARKAGILSAVASGNSGALSLDYPACSPYSLSVGAVYDTDIGAIDWGCGTKDISAPDKITCFTCRSSDLKMVAPGVRIVAAGITMTGTSQATPHVAGAIAVVKSAFPNDTADQTQDRLTSTGKPFPLANFPLAKTVRLDLAAALGPQCTYVLPTELRTLDEISEVSFTTGSNCKWTATSAASWVKITSATSGQGSGKFTIQMEKPLVTERSSTVTLSGDGASVSIKITQPPDTEPPTGSLTFNGNMNTQYTSSRTVNLGIEVKDISGIDSMCISNTSTCSQFVPFDAAPSWDLLDGDGVKTVSVFLKDKLGNTTKPEQPISKTIILDTTPPTTGTLTAMSLPATQSVLLEWSGFSDTNSPIQNYTLVVSNSQAPSTCSEGTQLQNNGASSFNHGPIGPGTYYYRVCATNAANLVSTGASTSITVTEADKTPPSGSVKINGNVPFTKSNAVTLTLQATDASGVAKMCVSATNTCQTWESFSSSKSLNLTTTQGNKIIYVWFEDTLGNRSSSPTTDDIILDTIAPSTGRIIAQASQNSAQLSWTAGSDTNGVASYKLVFRAGVLAPKANCTDGTNITVTPGFLMATATNLASKTYYAFRVCAIDRAGNVGSGSTVFTRTL